MLRGEKVKLNNDIYFELCIFVTLTKKSQRLTKVKIKNVRI